MQLSTRTRTLRLAETFTIARSSVDTEDVCTVELVHEGVTAHGEGAPVSYEGESAQGLVEAVRADGAGLLGEDLRDVEGVARRLRAWDGPQGAKMALDGAVHDWVGKRYGLPVWRLLGLDGVGPPTSFTLGIADVAGTVARLQRARRLHPPDFAVYKVKVGGEHDLARLRALREATDVPFRIDGNEGWTLEVAEALLPELVALGVQFVEQPFPAADLDSFHAYRRLPGRLPVLVDEGCRDLADVAPAAGYADGVVVKLAKAGGIREALRMVHAARALGLQVMLGCMIESQLGIAQAAQLAPLVDHVDLDGHLLLDEASFTGLGLRDGRLVLPDAPGLGVAPAGEAP